MKIWQSVHITCVLGWLADTSRFGSKMKRTRSDDDGNVLAKESRQCTHSPSRKRLLDFNDAASDSVKRVASGTLRFVRMVTHQACKRKNHKPPHVEDCQRPTKRPKEKTNHRPAILALFRDPNDDDDCGSPGDSSDGGDDDDMGAGGAAAIASSRSCVGQSYAGHANARDVFRLGFMRVLLNVFSERFCRSIPDPMTHRVVPAFMVRTF